MTTDPTAQITFVNIEPLVTCGEATIEWKYNGTTISTSNYPLVITNIGVSQTGSSRREYPLVSRQSTTGVVNTTLSLVNVAAQQFNWIKVDVPQGWYRMEILTATEDILSNVFNVFNGTDVSCVVIPSQSSTLPSSSTSSILPSSSIAKYNSTTPVNSSPASTSTSVAVGSSTGKRRIVGGVLGAVAVLALIAAIFLWASRRRRTKTRNATKRRPPKGHRHLSDSTGAILPFGGGNQEDSPQLSITDEDFASEKSAVAEDYTTPKLPSIAATRSHPQSPTSSGRPASMVVKPSFESSDTLQSRPSASPIPPRHPSVRGRRTSRKPVPVYDPGEFPGSEVNDIPLTDRPEGDLGGGPKIYYLTPDAPLEQRK